MRITLMKWSILPVLLVGLSGCSVVGFPSGRGSAPSPSSGPTPRPTVVVPGPSVPAAPTGAFPGGATRGPDNGRTYEVFGEEYRVLDTVEGYRERGRASWYGAEFHGRPTASGETFDQHGLSAAHRTLPLHTWVEVTNLDNGRRAVLRINDRGPFARTHERIIDLSYGAALQLGVVGPGTAEVEVRALAPHEIGERSP